MPIILSTTSGNGNISLANRNNSGRIGMLSPPLTTSTTTTTTTIPPIVTSGLVLNLDAGNTSSYPGSGSTWTDISGNGYTGTLINSPTFNSANGGYITFNGTNQYTTTTYTQPAYGTATSFTWNVWVNIPDLVNINSPIIGNRGGGELIFIKITKGAFEYYPLNMLHTLTQNVWQNVCIVKNGTSFTYYKNNSVITTATSSATQRSTTPFYIGGDAPSNEYFVGNISNVQVYNSALSATDVAQNYNALKSRFGL